MDKGQIDEIRQRTSLQSLVAARVALQRRGRRYIGLCPFHKEKTPSFNVVEDEGFYYCFGCAERGDAFDWLQKTQGMSFRQALEQLAKQAGVVLPVRDESAQARATRESGDARKEKQHERLRAAMQAAVQFYHRELLSPTGARARAYLRARAIDKAIARRFTLGWADGDSRRFFEHMEQQNFSSGELLTAGLAVSSSPAPASNSLRARFRSRIIFPIDDRQGRSIAFGGRLLEKDNAQNEEANDKNHNNEQRFVAPKYLNSPETPLFSKGSNLYNFARAKESTRGNLARGARGERGDKESVLLVEGYMDVIALDKVGYSASVASLGTALSERQLALLWQLADEPILCFDGDRAGLLAASRAVKRALPSLNEGKNLRVFFLPEGYDPDSFVNKFGIQQWRKSLLSAETVSEFLWRVEKAEYAPIDSPEKLAQLDKALEQHSQSIEARTLQKHYRAFFNDSLFQERRSLQSASARARAGIREVPREVARAVQGQGFVENYSQRTNARTKRAWSGSLNSNAASANFMLFSNDEALRARALQERLIIVLAKNPDLWGCSEERFACIELPQDLDATRQAMLLAYANAKPDEDIGAILWQSGGEALRSLARSQKFFMQNSHAKGFATQEIVDKILAALDYIEISKDLAQAKSETREQTIGLREDARRIFTQQ